MYVRTYAHTYIHTYIHTRPFHLTHSGIPLHMYVRSMYFVRPTGPPHSLSTIVEKSQPHPYDLCRDVPIPTTLSSAVGEEDKSHLVQWVVLALVSGVDGSPHCAGQPPVGHISPDQLGASLVLSRSVWAGQKGSGRGRREVGGAEAGG